MAEEKELRKMNRTELIEIIYALKKEEEEVNQKLEDWQRFNHTLEQHLRSVECEKIHDICQAVYGMKHPSDELEGLYLSREDEQICLLYYQVFVGMLEININSAEVLYKQKEEIINE